MTPVRDSVYEAVQILPGADVVVAKGRCRVAVQRCLGNSAFCVCVLYVEDIKMHWL